MDKQNLTAEEVAATEDAPEMPEMTDEEIAALDKQRAAEEEAKLAPCKKAAQQRKNNAAVIAEHDELLADVLYEITVGQLEG